VSYFSRVRFIANLLPLIQSAPDFRRVVTTIVGAHEGPLMTEDPTARNIPLTKSRGHLATMTTLNLEHFARLAPTVTFIHNFPGSVKTGIVRGDEGLAVQVMKVVFMITLPFLGMPIKECGERHSYLCTSARYPAAEIATGTRSGVPISENLDIARGIDGKLGSGVYSLTSVGESADPKAEAILAKYLEDGTVERLWERTENEFNRVTRMSAL